MLLISSSVSSDLDALMVDVELPRAKSLPWICFVGSLAESLHGLHSHCSQAMRGMHRTKPESYLQHQAQMSTNLGSVPGVISTAWSILGR